MSAAAVLALVALAPDPGQAAAHVPRLELRLELPAPSAAPARGGPPPVPGRPGALAPGEAAIVVTLVNDAAQPVDASRLEELRPELVDGAGVAVPLSDQRIYAMPTRRMTPTPGPTIVEPGQRREVARWLLVPDKGHTALRVPHGAGALRPGRYVITVRASLRSAGTVEGWIADAARLYQEQGLDADAARRRADEDGARLRPAFARLAVAWQGDAAAARYALTIP